MAHASGITHLGIRNLGSSSRADFAEARRGKSDILSVRDIRASGIDAVVGRLELTPALDPGGATAFFAAQLLANLLG